MLKSARTMAAWILSVFRDRSQFLILTLFKTMVRSESETRQRYLTLKLSKEHNVTTHEESAPVESSTTERLMKLDLFPL